jgi:FlaA1/EpsC-like NDP-sugar epimerase
MTLPEAAQLIIQAGSMGKGGEIFVLKMGDQIKIIDIAKDLVVFSGKDPDKVKFITTGLRPGEKLEEELIGKNETVQLTSDEKILIINSRNHIPYTELQEAIDELRHYVDTQNVELAIEKTKSIVETYS